MKKLMSLVLALVMCLSLSAPAFAVTREPEANESSIHVIDKETRQRDIQRQVDALIASLVQRDALLRDDYRYSYSSEYGTPKYVTRGDYPRGQLEGGVKFAKPGGFLSWKPDGGNKLDASVSFSYPFKAITVSVDLGVAKNGEGFTYSQFVDNYTDYVKLYVNKTMEVQPVVIYKTEIRTGEKSVYMTSYPATMYSFSFEVRTV